MRIGFDGKRICCNQRGLGNYGRNLVDSLTITHPELECTLFSPQRAGPALQQWESSFLAQPNHHLVTPTGAWALWGSGWRTIKPASLAAKDQLDIYHGLSHELPWGISQSGIKSVVTIHDLLYLRLPQHYSLIDRTVYHQKVLYSCRHADQI
ncbi:MAG: glycosyltransferase family 1 protein, partial [Bdellovibrionales bacterium]|nr:glycosyltransferase family 1 protein [Bdellovibrionales bacterium]